VVEVSVNHAANEVFGRLSWKKVIQVMQQEFPWLNQQKVHSRCDILTEKSVFLTVVELRDIEGATGHVVTIFENIIFDSTSTNAFPLTIDALDFCCSTDDKKIKFHSVYHGFRFQEQQNDRKGRWLAHLSKHFPDSY
jgi:hypothetical protein